MNYPEYADSKVIWMDGKLIPYAEATIPFLTHSFQYGTAVFEGIRAYENAAGQPAIFRAREHFVRFFDSMRAMGYVSKETPESLIAATRETIKANGFKSCYVRPVAYVNDCTRGLKLAPHPKANIAIATWDWGKYMGDEGQKSGVRVMVSTFRRPDISTAMTWAKLSGSYLTSVLARREASLHQMDEAILLDPLGFVAEGSGENLFMVKSGSLFTPNTGYILPGITRDCIFRFAKDLGLALHEGNITRNQLYLADEVFFTGTAAEITPIREVDHRPIGQGAPGPITKNLMNTFYKCLKGENPQYKEWLTSV